MFFIFFYGKNFILLNINTTLGENDTCCLADIIFRTCFSKIDTSLCVCLVWNTAHYRGNRILYIDIIIDNYKFIEIF